MEFSSKRPMNKLRCLLSGGHRYSHTKIITHRNEVNRTIELRNFCVKCSKMISFEIPDNFIDKEIEKAKIKQWERWSYGT